MQQNLAPYCCGASLAGQAASGTNMICRTRVIHASRITEKQRMPFAVHHYFWIQLHSASGELLHNCLPGHGVYSNLKLHSCTFKTTANGKQS